MGQFSEPYRRSSGLHSVRPSPTQDQSALQVASGHTRLPCPNVNRVSQWACPYERSREVERRDPDLGIGLNGIMTEREFAIDVVRRLREAGFEALWAGGCVRDEVMGHEPHDYDVATGAPPEEVRKL